MRYKKKTKKRTGLGTGSGCMALNIRDQKDCPFQTVTLLDEEEFSCNINDDEDCDLDACKLKEYGRIIVVWTDEVPK